MLKSDEYILLVGYNKEVKQLPNNIIQIPLTNSQEELAVLYNMADVVVSFSYAESFGMTIIEGMACGTPAVVYDNTALPDLISTNTGIVVPTGDIQKAYEAISEIRRRGKGAYTADCRTNALVHFNQDMVRMHYAELYRKC